MQARQFKIVKNIIEYCDSKNHIFWEGYVWVNLTQKQCETAARILYNRGFELKNDCVVLPSGISLRLPDDCLRTESTKQLRVYLGRKLLPKVGC